MLTKQVGKGCIVKKTGKKGGYVVEKTIKEMGEKTVKEGFALRRSQAKKRAHIVHESRGLKLCGHSTETS